MAASSSHRRTSTLATITADGTSPRDLSLVGPGAVGPGYGARIVSAGHYVPEGVVTNKDFERSLETSDEWIVERTGMRERRYADAATATSDMAIAAAKVSLERAKLSASDIDCFIVATVTPDHQFPATACIVASHLGAVGKAAFDIEIACSGFVYGLPMAASFIRSGVFRRVMVIGAEKLSGIVDQKDRGTAVLFGDGAGAVIVERAERDSFLGCELGADGANHEMLWVPSGGSREPLTAEGIAERRQFVHMTGREIFKYAVTKMAESSQIVLDRLGLSAADVDLVIPHQANLRIIDALARRLEISMDRVVVNIERYGNTSSASIAIALSETIERDFLKDGDLVLFVAFGGGLSWGAIAWRWAA